MQAIEHPQGRQDGTGSSCPSAAPRNGARPAALAILAIAAGLAQAGTPLPGQPDANLVPNSSLRGSFGVLGQSNGTATGVVPTLWRGAAIDGGAIVLEKQMLAPGTLFPGSPATEAVKFTVTNFGAAQVFDHANAMFPIIPGRSYSNRVYVRTGNANNSAQSFNVSMPFFDAAQMFFGRDPSNFTASATSTWAAFDSPSSLVLPGEALAHLAFRLNDDGGENSIIVAMPSVEGPPVYNIAPNPGFSGSAGPIQGMVTGTVPNNWRAFAVSTNPMIVATVPLAANALYPGSPATNAIRLQVNGGDGTFEGFDHEISRALLSAPYRHWGEVYMRSGNAAPQGVLMSFPLFDAGGVFTGQAPGSFVAEVGTDWALYAGPSFAGTAGHSGNMGFRLLADGSEDSILIALPRIVGPEGPVIFRNGFDPD